MKNVKIKSWICNLFSKMRTALADQLGEIDTSVYEKAVKNAVGCSSKTVKIGKVNYTVNLHFLPDGRSIEDCVETSLFPKHRLRQRKFSGFRYSFCRRVRVS